jgi:hypothetical protein
MEINKQAWELLSSDEKMALSLHHGLDKSSWEVGEIMNKSHYKLLEIKYRAEKFLKMFTEHLEKFHELFPNYITGDSHAISYFRSCIEHRKKPMEALEQIEKTGKMNKTILNDKIRNTLKKWEDSNNVYNATCYELVKEFDRWNNFRILPKDIQEPSAFKRRVKNYHKKQIKNVISIHPIALEKFKKLYCINSSPSLYLPLLSPQPEILRIKINKACMETINSLGLYTFTRREDATTYSNEVWDYISKGKKQCIDGLDFWPKYRELIKKSKNYHEVMNLVPSRKHLQLAMEKFTLM